MRDPPVGSHLSERAGYVRGCIPPGKRDAVGGEGDNSVGMPGGAWVLAEARTRPASARGIPGAVGEIVKEQSKREREREEGRGIFRGRADSQSIFQRRSLHTSLAMEWMHA